MAHAIKDIGEKVRKTVQALKFIIKELKKRFSLIWELVKINKRKKRKNDRFDFENYIKIIFILLKQILKYMVII